MSRFRTRSVIYRETGPSRTNGGSSDSVSVISIDEEGEQTIFHFAPEAPGKFSAIRQTGDQDFDETRIEAYWRDTAAGYQLEARIPRNLTGPRLGVTVRNTDNEIRAGVSSASFTGRAPGPVVTVSPVLESVAAGYVQPGLRLIITDKDGWRLAVAGSISTSPAGATAAEPPSGWLRLVYNLLARTGRRSSACRARAQWA